MDEHYNEPQPENLAPLEPNRDLQALQAEKERESRREQRLNSVAEDFGFFGGLCVVFGVLGTFFLYGNPSGITFPMYVMMIYGLAWLILKRREVPVKRMSLFLAGVSILLGISTCLTADPVIHRLNRTALFLLFCVFVLHQRYGDARWNIGKYLGAIAIFLGQTLCFIASPFQHGIRFFRSINNRKYKNLVWLLAGFCVAVPAAILLSVLLASADRVFESVLDWVIVEVLNPFTVIPVMLWTVAGIVGMYCLICSFFAGEIREEVTDKRRAEPLIAISFMTLIGLIYLVFCGIQVVYLFMGKGSLPDGMTYSSYARQGFFQLLFVAVVNLVMVLLCLKYFRRSVILNIVLLVISLCTYVMIASAFYRMVLYVEQYQLTYLRLIVLWFLIMLAVLMAGVVTLIFKNEFPLFRHFLVVISVFYLVFAWAKPGSVIARYNLKPQNVAEAGGTQDESAEFAQGSVSYLYELSADAAPAVAENIRDPELRRGILSFYANRYNGKTDGILSWNFSYSRVCGLLGEQQEGESRRASADRRGGDNKVLLP